MTDQPGAEGSSADTKNTSDVGSFMTTEPTSVSHDGIGALIGKGGVGVKKCLANSFRMYERVQSSDKRVSEEKPTLRIVYRNGEPGAHTDVYAEIFSESETMHKIASMIIRKHVTDCGSKRGLASHSFIIEYPHNLVGHFVGKGWKNVNRIMSSTIYGGNGGNGYNGDNGDNGDNDPLINGDDIATAETARLNVFPNPQRPSPFDNIETTGELLAFVKERHNTCFIGWPPEESEELAEYIMVTVSFHRHAKPFKDRCAYIDRLRDEIIDSVEEIKSKNDTEMDEINELLGF